MKKIPLEKLSFLEKFMWFLLLSIYLFIFFLIELFYLIGKWILVKYTYSLIKKHILDNKYMQDILQSKYINTFI